MWGSPILLVALFGISAFAEQSPFIFPEEARELSGGQSRIVSGWPASPGQIPHQLSIRMVNDAGFVSMCGASLVHQQWAISAAHCTAQRTTLVVRAGTNLTRPYIIFETTQMYNHPYYNEFMPFLVQPNDISLVRFQRPLEFSDLIQPIRIARHEDRDKNFDRVRLVASGWGLTWTYGNTSEVLNWVYLAGVTNQLCLSVYDDSWLIQDTTVCTSGYNDTTQNPCQGDSGGPLTMLEEDGKPSLVGVGSFVAAVGCHADMPAGFTRAAHYHAWYREVTGIDFDWDWDSDENSTDDPYNASLEEAKDGKEEQDNSYERGMPNGKGEVFEWLKA